MGVKFGWYYKMAYLCTALKQNAEIAQLVEHNLAKVRVASSSLVFRSLFLKDARMVESVDTRDLKSLGHCGCAGSSPASSTRCNCNHWKTDDCDFCFVYSP